MQINRYSFRSDNHLGLEVVPFEKLYEARRILTRAHRASFYHIIWFQRGTLKHTVDFREVDIQPDSLLFLDREIVHQYEDASDPQGLAILFTEEMLYDDRSALRQLLTNPLFSNLIVKRALPISKNKAYYERLFLEIHKESLRNTDNIQTPLLRTYLKTLMLSAERDLKEIYPGTVFGDCPEAEVLSSFIALLEQDFKADRKVSSYAVKMGITRKRLITLCTNRLGRGPKEIIDDRVMLESRRLLAQRILSVKEITYELGFDEPTNFSKFFKNHSGLSPGQFQQQLFIEEQNYH